MKSLRLVLLVSLSLLWAGNALAAQKVYLVNGLFSKALGYGLTNLSKKIPQARHFKFTGGVSQKTVNGIIADATRAYKANNNIKISLVGISQGANAVSRIAAALNKNGVAVHYLAIIEGGSLAPVHGNVKKVDNFICTHSTCARTPVSLAGGNSTTRLKTFNLDTGHVDSGNHPTMHNRVISQIR